MHAVEKMMFTGKKPWWYGNAAQQNAVGVDLGEGPVTSAEAIAAAGLDWEVAKTPAYYKVNDDYQEADNEKFLIRTTDHSVLGRCTDQYEVFQNREAFTFMDSLVNEEIFSITPLALLKRDGVSGFLPRLLIVGRSLASLAPTIRTMPSFSLPLGMMESRP